MNNIHTELPQTQRSADIIDVCSCFDGFSEPTGKFLAHLSRAFTFNTFQTRTFKQKH